jgi:hypothetical protein
MAVSKQIQLAQAQRRLRRLEEDAAAFRIRLADLPVEHRKPMQRWFQEMVEQQRDAVRRLEGGSGDRDRRSSAA